jgi:hypothetical protein
MGQITRLKRINNVGKLRKSKHSKYECSSYTSVRARLRECTRRESTEIKTRERENHYPDCTASAVRIQSVSCSSSDEDIP